MPPQDSTIHSIPTPPQSPSPTPNPTPSGKNVLIVKIIALVILLGIGGIAGTKFYNSQKKSMVTDTNNTIVNSKVFTKEQVQSLMAVKSEEYNNALQAPVAGLEKPANAATVGPIVISLRNRSMEVIMPPIPNVTTLEKSALIFVESVTDRSGKTYPQDDPEKTDSIFLRADMRVSELPTLLLVGSRTLFVDEIENNADIASVKGKFMLNIPVDIRSLTLTSADSNQQKTSDGTRITLNSIESHSQTADKDAYTIIELTYAGKEENLIDIKAYDKTGKELQYQSKSWNTTESTSQGVVMSVVNQYDGEVNSIKVYVASSFYVKEYPFTVSNSLPAPLKNTQNSTPINNQQTTTSMDTTEKEQIITTILKTQSILSSKDEKKIRAYLATTAPSPEALAQLDTLSDEKVFEMAEFISSFSLTEAELRSPEAVWQIGDTEATVSIKDAQGLSQSTTIKKINGKWQ